MNEANERLNDPEAEDVLSPELALVDADLARVARSRMPKSGGSAIPPPRVGVGSEPRSRAVDAATVSRERPAPAVTPEERSDSPDEASRSSVVEAGRWPRNEEHAVRGREAAVDGRGRPLGRRLASPVPLLAVLAPALAAVAFAAVIMPDDRAGSPRAETTAGTQRPSIVVTDSDTRPSVPISPTRTSSKPRERPPQSSAGEAATRVFVWLGVRGASHYKVEFFRSGKKIFEATPARPRLKLPERWEYRGRRFELDPGKYRWSVRAGFGPRSNARYGRAIVASRLTVRP